MNTQIDRMANSIKALGTAKIMLTIYHEPEGSISAGGSPSCPALFLEGTSGSTADYVDMWHNVRQRFDALGVSNVVWVMNYVGYVTKQCVTKDLWPGNNYVDWVMWDPYPKNAAWTATVGSFYNYLTANSDAEHDFLSKPWGLAEYGYVGSNQNAAYGMYDEARRNLQNGVHPRLKAYIVWDNYTSNSHDDRVGFAETHVADPDRAAALQRVRQRPAADGHRRTRADRPDAADRRTHRSRGRRHGRGRGQRHRNGHRRRRGRDRGAAPRRAHDRLPDPGADGAVSFDWNSATVANGSYTLRLRARDAASNIGQSEEATVTVENMDDEAPSAPTDVDATWSRTSQVTVTWSEATDNAAVTGYRVYRDGDLIGSPGAAARSFNDTTVSNLVTHTYTVTAVDAADHESEPSNEAVVDTGDDTPPTAPTTVDATLTGSEQATVTWSGASDNGGVVGYRVYRNGTLRADVTDGSGTLVDDGLDDATTYTYRVAAYDAQDNVSPLSDPASVTTDDATAPAVPQNLRAVSSPQSVALAWNASSDNVGVTNYVVYRDGLPQVTLGSTATSWTDSAPNGNTLHRYQVTAGDAEGNESEKSNEVARTVDATAPSTPLNLRAVSSPQSVALAWNASTDNVGVTSYVVYRDGLPRATLAGTATRWTDTAPTGSTLHRYQVTAGDASGNESAKSNEVARTVDTAAPSVPLNVRAVSTASTVALTWSASTDNVGVTNYIVYRDGVRAHDPRRYDDELDRHRSDREHAAPLPGDRPRRDRQREREERPGVADPGRHDRAHGPDQAGPDALGIHGPADVDRGDRQRRRGRLHDLSRWRGDRHEHDCGVHRHARLRSARPRATPCAPGMPPATSAPRRPPSAWRSRPTRPRRPRLAA